MCLLGVFVIYISTHLQLNRNSLQPYHISFRLLELILYINYN